MHDYIVLKQSRNRAKADAQKQNKGTIGDEKREGTIIIINGALIQPPPPPMDPLSRFFVSKVPFMLPFPPLLLSLLLRPYPTQRSAVSSFVLRVSIQGSSGAMDKNGGMKPSVPLGFRNLKEGEETSHGMSPCHFHGGQGYHFLEMFR